MKKPFDITVVRIGYGFKTITVQAKNEKEAEQLALDEAGDHEYSEKSADYEVEGSSAPKQALISDMTELIREVAKDLNTMDKSELTRFEKNLLKKCEKIISKL